MKQLLFFLAISFTTWTTTATADEPRIGLVLSGGGARGLAHIGVLRALEAHNIKISAIAGTSMGAIVGALYASGKTPDELERIALEIDWSQALADEPSRDRLSFRRKRDTHANTIKAQATLVDGIISLPKGVVQGQNLQIMLQKQFLHVTDITDFDKLRIPFRAVASDLVTGEAYVFSRGSLATAVRASMSIPGIFSPVEFEGHMLADGGIANNLPVDVVKAMGVDYVIAVDIATPLYTAEELNSVIPIIEQLTTLLTFNQIKVQYALLGDNDILVTPDLSDVGTADFDRIEVAISRGYEAMMGETQKLAKLSSPNPIEHQTVERFEPPTIDSIEIENHSDVSDKLIMAQIRQQIGQRFDENRLRQDIESIYGYQYFESVQYEIIEDDDKHKLRIKTFDRSWGKDLLGVSFEIFSDIRAESEYNIGATFTKAGVTSTGGEWFNALQIGQDPGVRTELYLPIDYQQRAFVRPYLSYTEDTYSLTANNMIQSRIRIDEFLAGTFFGVEVGNEAIVGFGIEHHKGDIKTFVGTPVNQVLFTDDLAYAMLERDTLDDVSFPRSGTLTHLRYNRVHPDGAPDYDLIDLSHKQALPVLGDSLILTVQYVRSNSATVGRHLQPSLGGMAHLSGLHQDSLVGNNLAYLSLTYLRRLDEQSILPVDLPVYVGFGLEAGNVWASSHDMSPNDLIGAALIMLGVDTPLGPLYIGYGRAETDDNAFYLKLGHLN